jgi:hypothetical protein
MSSLRDRLEEFKRTFESGVPPYNATREAVATMHRATAELKASGIESAALKVGDHAPDFSLFNQDHVRVTSTEQDHSCSRCERRLHDPTGAF